MTMPKRYIRTLDGRLVAVPMPAPATPEVEPVEEAVEAIEPKGDDGVSDLFEGYKKEDITDLFEAEEESEVSEEDVLGEGEPEAALTEEDEEYLFGVKEKDVVEEPPKPPKPKLRRTVKRFPPPPTTLGEMRP